jgi:hypothetical protein
MISHYSRTCTLVPASTLTVTGGGSIVVDAGALIVVRLSALPPALSVDSSYTLPLLSTDGSAVIADNVTVQVDVAASLVGLDECERVVGSPVRTPNSLAVVLTVERDTSVNECRGGA